MTTASPSRLDSIQHLVQWYRDLRLQRAAEEKSRTARLKTDLDRFWPAFHKLTAAHAERTIVEAPGFSLLKLAGIQYERLHTGIIADLLNPSGSHKQGRIFLEEFLRVVGRSDLLALLVNRVALITVTTETPIPSRRRLDIVIRSSAGFLIIIENKIRHVEGPNQLRDYSVWLKSEPEPEDQKILVFLTIHRERATSIREGYLAISYLKEIDRWLTDCLARITAPRVREAVSQYLDCVQELRALREEPVDASF